ncbi:MAG: hypothetical protein LBF80_07090 [Spirochaetaceae bacterium]|jgi:ABC-type dipeptide/oligopeptide/nickel transport system ATPase component|nr:hypothetical protein [Spirochaetaceae bacterium]
MIAMALACEPALLIADEPTTALDTTIQAQILELIESLNKKNNMAVLFISHDLGVVAEICSTVKVMYLGQFVEEAPSAAVLSKAAVLVRNRLPNLWNRDAASNAGAM